MPKSAADSQPIAIIVIFFLQPTEEIFANDARVGNHRACRQWERPLSDCLVRLPNGEHSLDCMQNPRLDNRITTELNVSFTPNCLVDRLGMASYSLYE